MTPIRSCASAVLAAFGLALAAPAAAAPAAALAAVPVAVAPDRAPLAAGTDAAEVILVDKRDRRPPGYYPPRDNRGQRYQDKHRPQYRYEYDRHERWRTKRSPRYSYWKGRRLPPRGHYYVIRDYRHYYLPPPPRGYYYVRNGNDVFLVLEATRTIIDAFILLELLGR